MVRRSSRLAAIRARRARERERRAAHASRSRMDESAERSPKRSRMNELDHGRRRPPKSAGEIEREVNERKEMNNRRMLEQKQKESAFKVEKIDFHLEENEKKHRTDEYEKDELVLRRGQLFDLSVVLKCTSPFDPKKDQITLCFEIGQQPSQSRGTIINVKNVPSLEGVKDWAAKIISVNNDVVKFKVMTSPAAVVGKYTLTVKTVNKDIDVKWSYTDDLPIYVLFNAWCEDDAVYMPDEKERQEYVLNENGQIWQHSYYRKKGLEWYFGQFEEVSLDCALHLLFDLSPLKPYMMGNPILVTRTLSALINSMDDDGVLIGNWSGDYEDGVNPSVWDGSVKILQKFMKTGESVKYGQCWVFSGVFTTLARALGIPTRSVTNFDSAHDTDGSVTIDMYYDAETYDWLDDKNEDSVWNFHVWNECFYKRPDLPPGYDGWQAVDSTPQEASSGTIYNEIMCCGPAPLKAIKEGDLGYSYDTRFIFAEVNGDRVFWAVDKYGEATAQQVDKNHVGKCIITKRVGDIEEEPYGVDIQSEYKYSGAREDAVLKKAVTFGSKLEFLGELYDNEITKDLNFSCALPEDVVIGEDVAFKLNMKNTSSKVRTVSVNMQVRAAFYTGVVNPKACKVEKSTIKVPGGSEKDATIHLSMEDYVDVMEDAQCVFKVYFQAVVVETSQKFLTTKDFRFDPPSLELECPKDVYQDKPFKVSVSFTNPLSRPLVGGVLNIDGRKLNDLTVKQKPVPPYGEFSAEVDVLPLQSRRRRGRTLLKASFTSKQLSASGSFWVTVCK